MIALEEHVGMYIKVRVTAGSKKESVTKISDTHFAVHVREQAERNMANTRVIQVIAAHFGVQRTKIRIISGHHTPGKILSVDSS